MRSKSMSEDKKKVYAFPNKATPSQPVLIDPDICTGCNMCVDICPMDVLVPNPKKGNPPITLYPEECWYDGSCVGECPFPGAIKFRLPFMSRVHWKNKETGEHFRV